MNSRSLVALPAQELVPLPGLFDNNSELHGRMHVARVMVHAFRLIHATGSKDLSVPLWAAVYIHDLGRAHDGFCEEHGRWSVEKWHASPVIQETLLRGGLKAEQIEVVETAVKFHCMKRELGSKHPHYPLTALLKDADALDRVRLGDLDLSYLRHKEAKGMVGFAESLCQKSLRHPEGVFERLGDENTHDKTNSD